MVGNGWKWFKMVRNDWEWLEMVQNGQNWLEMVINDQGESNSKGDTARGPKPKALGRRTGVYIG